MSSLRTLPRSIWALGFVSLFMDVSSEMIHGLLPVYLVAVLGASALTVGVIEGIAEATASICKVFSGALSDALGRRKLLVVLGYGMAALTKPAFPLASGIEPIVAARFLDRVGKGIRGAPRDALVADLAPPAQRGAAYGLRQSLDTVGAFLGPLLAIALMAITAGDFRFVLWVAVIPAFLALGIAVFGVSDAPVTPRDAKSSSVVLLDPRGLPGVFWAVLAVGSVLTLARFSEAFLILRAEELGLATTLAPLVLVLMNLVYSAGAYPMGRMADRLDAKRLLAWGCGALIAADLFLASAAGLGAVALGVALWGLHLALTQGLLATLVARAAPADRRGTAFGVFNLATGLALLLASVIAGGLWQGAGPATTFLAGAIFAGVALLALLLLPAHRLVEVR